MSFEDALDKLMRRDDFDTCFRGALAGYVAYRPNGRMYRPDGQHGVVIRLDRERDTLTADSKAGKLYFDTGRHSDILVRYTAIRQYLQSLSTVPALLLLPEAHDAAFVSPSGRHPVVTMPWISGRQLGHYVTEGYASQDGDDRVQSRAYAAEFLLGMSELERTRVSHGDICPANIMVSNNGRLLLVDYDNMFVPPLAGRERFSGASIMLVAESLGSTSFDDRADRGATLRLFVELYCLSRDRHARFGHQDWLLDLDRATLLDELRRDADTRELVDYYLQSLATHAHPSATDILASCMRVRDNVRRCASRRGGVCADLWDNYVGAARERAEPARHPRPSDLSSLVSPTKKHDGSAQASPLSLPSVDASRGRDTIRSAAGAPAEGNGGAGRQSKPSPRPPSLPAPLTKVMPGAKPRTLVPVKWDDSAMSAPPASDVGAASVPGPGAVSGLSVERPTPREDRSSHDVISATARSDLAAQAQAPCATAPTVAPAGAQVTDSCGASLPAGEMDFIRSELASLRSDHASASVNMDELRQLSAKVSEQESDMSRLWRRLLILEIAILVAVVVALGLIVVVVLRIERP